MVSAHIDNRNFVNITCTKSSNNTILFTYTQNNFLNALNMLVRTLCRLHSYLILNRLYHRCLPYLVCNIIYKWTNLSACVSETSIKVCVHDCYDIIVKYKEWFQSKYMYFKIELFLHIISPRPTVSCGNGNHSV